MVMRNCLAKRDGDYNCETPTRRPRRFAFDIGHYNVSLHKKQDYGSTYRYYHVAVWDQGKKIGSIDLSSHYHDVKTVFSVDTRIKSDYQGLGIAYRVYEGLVHRSNMAIHSGNQSEGAVKLWRKFVLSGGLRLYFVDDYNGSNLLECDVHEMHLSKKGNLEGVDLNGKAFNPYRRKGSLLLVRKNGALDKTIQRNMPIRAAARKLKSRFKRYDKVKV